MSKESYARGFCKAAAAAGVDPVALAKYAAPKRGRRPPTVFERYVDEVYPVPKAVPEVGVALSETAKRNAARAAAIRRDAKDLELPYVNPTLDDLMRFKEEAGKAMRPGYGINENRDAAHKYWETLKDSRTDTSKKYDPDFSKALPRTYFPFEELKEFVNGGGIPTSPTRLALLKTLYSAHTNAQARASAPLVTSSK